MCWPKSGTTAELSRIPVIVLTASAADEDVLRSYDFRAAGYVTKPNSYAA
jgi:CheY-like chemotaxis protein